MTDRTVRERVIEAYLVRELKKYFLSTKTRGIVKKIGGPGWRGWPDRNVLFTGGIVHWLEVKRPKGGRFEPLQLRTHEKLRSLGFTVRVVNTKSLVDAYVYALRTFGPDAVSSNLYVDCKPATMAT